MKLRKLSSFMNLYHEWKDTVRLNRIRKKIKVASLEETIDKIVKDKCSISRFGDGEFYIMDGNGIKFQSADVALSDRLKQIISSNEPTMLICIGEGINPKNYYKFTPKHVDWMKKHFRNTIDMRLQYMAVEKQYYNLLISRFWIPYKNKEEARHIARKLKSIWHGRDVAIIEGEKTRMGVGNDLLEGVNSCHRILCPATSAFDCYDEILSKACTLPEDTLFLIALGPTASVLAYDLHKKGYQALDIGHVDIEYEWMKRGTTVQVKIENKFVNEVEGGNIVGDVVDAEYQNQILYKIEKNKVPES